MKTKRKKIIELHEVNLIDKLILKVILGGLLIIPLFIRLAIVQVYGPYILNSTFYNSHRGDFFSYFKFLLLCILTFVVVILFIIKYYRSHMSFKFEKSNICWGLLYLSVLISLILSDYKLYTLYGQLFEGTIAYLCYLLIYFVCTNIKYETNNLKLLIYPIGLITVINTIIGLLHFYGVNILSFRFINLLITNGNVGDSAAGYISSTFNNPNYASGIGSVIFIIFFSLSLLTQNMKRWFYIVLTCLTFALVLSTLSSSGFIAILFFIPISLIIIIRSIKPKQRLILPIILIVTICTSIYIPMNKYNPKIYQETFGLIAQGVDSIFAKPKPTNAVDKNFDEGSEESKNENSKNNNIDNMLEDVFGLPKPGIAPGSGRVYIWQKTLELIRERPIAGYGLGTMELYFDNNDINKIAALGTENIQVNKPHNYYLGLAYGIGILGLLFFLTLVICHLYDMFKIVLENSIKLHPIHISFFLGVLTFLFQALFNDSVIGMSIIFWMIFGVSVGLTRQSEAARLD